VPDISTNSLAPFSPPAWLRNSHLQSTLPTLSLWRWPVWQRSQALRAAAAAEIIAADGVRLSCWISRHAQAKRWVIVLHGWLGDAHSTYVLSLAAALYGRGYNVVRLNLRDHGGSEHLNEGLFHSCLLGDVLSAVKELQQRYDIDDLSLAGFSLGGNFALRVAARAAQQDIRLRRVAAICPALDPAACDAALSVGPPMYAHYFLGKWKQSLRRKQQLFPERYDFRLWLHLSSITALTDELVKRYAGFAGVREYYQGYSLLGDTLASLAAPCHVLLSDDDPIVPVQGMDGLHSGEQLHISRALHGGHCGFITGWSAPRWSDSWALSVLE
jgi:uncharacterized protein